MADVMENFAPEAFVVAIADVRRIVLGVKPVAARGQAGWSKKMQSARPGRARRFGATSGSGRVRRMNCLGRRRRTRMHSFGNGQPKASMGSRREARRAG
jgi:hypothetical protein